MPKCDRPIQETQLLLTNRTTHLCKRNGVADLKTPLPILVNILFCVKGCRIHWVWASIGAALRVKNLNDGATGPIKKFDDIFSNLDSGVGSNLEVGDTMPAPSAGRKFFDVPLTFLLCPHMRGHNDCLLSTERQLKW